MDGELYCDELLVGQLTNVFASDEKWFAHFESSVGENQSERARSMGKFISFCVEWNERARAGRAETSEFEKYADVVSSGRWRVHLETGVWMHVVDAPVFFEGGDVTWTVQSA